MKSKSKFQETVDLIEGCGEFPGKLKAKHKAEIRKQLREGRTMLEIADSIV